MNKKQEVSEVATSQMPSEPDLAFLLEDTYPNAATLFSSHDLPIARDGDFVVAIDTNVLILPYKIDANDLSALSSTYRALAKSNRLYLPARVSREFIRLRDKKLAEVVTGLNDRLSKLEPPKAKLSPILEGVEGYDKLPNLAESAEKAVREYRSALKNLIGKIKQWRGNDPVSMLYAEVFNEKNIIEAPGDRRSLKAEWSRRSEHKLPPGYKDSDKDDSGIGDFLIWKSILEIGRLLEKDLIFLTLDDKGDWAVRAGNEAVYPRPELVDEYRRSSNGRSLKISHLADFLRQMDVSEAVVAKVKEAETVEISRESIQLSERDPLYQWWTKNLTTEDTPRVRPRNKALPRPPISRIELDARRIRAAIYREGGPVVFKDVEFDPAIIGFVVGRSVLLQTEDGEERIAPFGVSAGEAKFFIDDLMYAHAVEVSEGDAFVVRDNQGQWQSFRIVEILDKGGDLILMRLDTCFGTANTPVLVP